MKIADLFINLGIKGADQTEKGLKNVNKGLSDIWSTSVALKAGVLGAMYALEQMMQKSAATGDNLKKFETYTGLSAQTLQKWQYAARQVGVSNDELTASVQGVQNAMTNMLMGKGAPEGMAMLANKVGFDVNRARDSFYVMEQLQKFAQKVPPDVANQMMKSFGVSEGTIQAMRRNAFTPAVMSRAPRYNEGEINQLQKVDAAWANIGQKIQMMVGHLNAKHGLGLIRDIEKIINPLSKTISLLITLAEKSQVFEMIGKGLEVIGQAIEGLNMLGEFAGDFIQEKTGIGAKDAKGKRKGPVDMLSDLVGKGIDKLFDEDDKTRGFNVTKVAPTMKPQSTSQNAVTNAPTTNVVVHNHGVKDAQDAAHLFKREIKNAHRQNAANGQGP